MGQFCSFASLPAKALKHWGEWGALCGVLQDQMPRLTKNLTPLEEITEVLSFSADFLINCVASLILRRVTTYTHTSTFILYLSMALGHLGIPPNLTNSTDSLKRY